MNQTKRRVSPALFCIILLCFLLPFVSVSCGGTEVFKLNGLDFVQGISEQGQGMDPSPLAIIALISAIIGLCIGFTKIKSANMIGAAVGIVGFVCDLVLRITFDNAVAEQGAQTSWLGGYYLSITLFAAAAVFNVYAVRNSGKQDELPSGPES